MAFSKCLANSPEIRKRIAPRKASDFTRPKATSKLRCAFSQRMSDSARRERPAGVSLSSRFRRSLRSTSIETNPSNAKAFWKELQDEGDYPLVSSNLPIPEHVAALLSDSLPSGAKVTYRVVRKGKGLGSLGRQRFVALTDWKGGFVGREAKALVPSAVEWLNNPHSTEIGAEGALKVAIRSLDPWYQIRHAWVVRLLAPDTVKIDLKRLGKQVHEDFFARKLLGAMGWETANIHLGSKEGSKLLKRLDKLQSMKKSWLQNAAERMADVMKNDFEAWKKR
jgi:hypothetical protein